MGNKCVQCLGNKKNIHDLDDIQRRVSGLEDIMPRQDDETPDNRKSHKGGRKGKKSIRAPSDIQYMMKPHGQQQQMTSTQISTNQNTSSDLQFSQGYPDQNNNVDYQQSFRQTGYQNSIISKNTYNNSVANSIYQGNNNLDSFHMPIQQQIQHAQQNQQNFQYDMVNEVQNQLKNMTDYSGMYSEAEVSMDKKMTMQPQNFNIYDQIVQQSQLTQSGRSTHHAQYIGENIKNSQHSMDFNQSNNQQMTDNNQGQMNNQFNIGEQRGRSNSNTNIAYQPIIHENSLDMTYEERMYHQTSMMSGNPNNTSHMMNQNNNSQFMNHNNINTSFQQQKQMQNKMAANQLIPNQILPTNFSMGMAPTNFSQHQQQPSLSSSLPDRTNSLPDRKSQYGHRSSFNNEMSFDNKKRMSFAMFEQEFAASDLKQQQAMMNQYFVEPVQQQQQQQQQLSKPINAQGPEPSSFQLSQPPVDRISGNNQDYVDTIYTQMTGTTGGRMEQTKIAEATTTPEKNKVLMDSQSSEGQGSGPRFQKKVSLNKKEQLLIDTEMPDSDSKYNVSGSKRAVKLMSKTIMGLKTPEKIQGKHIDDQLRLKISHKKEKVLSLQINIESPRYDDKGKPIFPDEDSEDAYDDPHSGYFNMHLLDETELDKQPYLGENSEEEIDQSTREKNLQEDMMKHLGIDFEFDQEEKLSYDDGGSVNSDNAIPLQGFRDTLQPDQRDIRDSMPQSTMPINSLKQLEVDINQEPDFDGGDSFSNRFQSFIEQERHISRAAENDEKPPFADDQNEDQQQEQPQILMEEFNEQAKSIPRDSLKASDLKQILNEQELDHSHDFVDAVGTFQSQGLVEIERKDSKVSAGSFVGQLYQEEPSSYQMDNYLGGPAGEGELIVDYEDLAGNDYQDFQEGNEDEQFAHLEVKDL